MPRRFVRESKFRHVFGDPYKKTKCYDNIDISKNTWDGGNYCAVNSKFVAVILERPGTFLVLPADKFGRVEATVPKVCGHKGRILDIQFNPFNVNIIASAGEDARIKVWQIPDEGLEKDLTESKIDLIGHSKKVGTIQWHPSAENVLASSGFDHELIIWDVQNGSPVHIISCHPDVINSFSWNKNGSRIITTCKDKMIRVIDPRDKEVLQCWKAHTGAKPTRAHFVDDDRVVTIGCQTSSEREISLWSLSNLDESIITHELDAGSGNILAMFDETLNILFIAVKGDCNIRYFEISKESPYIHYLNQFSSNIPQRGFGVLPKRALKIDKCEIFRLYKLAATGICEPISMIVPRKSDNFQSDIYPDVPGDNPALTAEQWFGGQDADPIMISLKDGFTPSEKTFVANVQNTEEDIFNVSMQTAPHREEDLRKAFYQQQDELHKLRELLKSKELRIRQLEYENIQLKRHSRGEEIFKDDLIKKALNGEDLTKDHVTCAEEVEECNEKVEENSENIDNIEGDEEISDSLDENQNIKIVIEDTSEQIEVS